MDNLTEKVSKSMGMLRLQDTAWGSGVRLTAG